MPKRREIPQTLKDQMIGLKKDGHSYRKISTLLDVPKSTVCFIITRWEKYGTTKNRYRPGRPKMMSPRGIRVLNSLVKKNRWRSLDKITADFNELAVIKPISANTIKRRLRELKYKPCELAKIAKKPFISGANRPKRKAVLCHVPKGHIKRPRLLNIELWLDTYFYSIPIFA